MIFGSSIPLSNNDKKKLLSNFWPPLTKLSGSAHEKQNMRQFISVCTVSYDMTTELQFGNLTCDPLIYIMSNPRFIVPN